MTARPVGDTFGNSTDATGGKGVVRPHRVSLHRTQLPPRASAAIFLVMNKSGLGI